MAARFKCLLVGDLPPMVDLLKAQRSGIDGTLGPRTEATAHAEFVNVNDSANLRNDVSEGLARAIEKMIKARSEEALLVLEGWNGSNIEAINYGLMDGARTLPPRRPRYFYEPPVFD